MDLKRVIVALTGASGVCFGIRLLERLLEWPEREIHLIISESGQLVIDQELGAWTDIIEKFLETSSKIHYHSAHDFMAGPASGSFLADAMIICPCSMRTLGAIAHGFADNLITRAADVMLKEGRALLLAPRESPLSLIHLRNMTHVVEAGAIVAPICPAFYHHPQTIEDLVDFFIQRILDRLGESVNDSWRWGHKHHK